MKTVLAFGSFDILHPGHLLYLEKAKKLGDRLVVVVARDESIRMFKGKSPAFNQNDRVKMLNALKIVDSAVLGNKLSKSSDRYKILMKYKPQVIVFGYDQKVNLNAIKQWLAQKSMHAEVVRIKVSANPKIYKSSRLRSTLL
ncbi:MAG: adenylyltransferase/cytidyltransferase family protein [Candidatus Micrarchaeales archaeon]